MSRVQKIIFAFITLVLLVGVGFGAYITYQSRPNKHTPLVYAHNQMLRELWNDYKNSNLEPGTGRTLDKQQNNITTSEGQSYTMLRSVWLDDRETFDKSWKWTKDNLQRDDHLLSWKFGEVENGGYGIQSNVGGENTASDGDLDVALSLLMAYSRWSEDDYLYDAMPMINSIWEKEVVMINGKPVLVANDLERNNKKNVIVNPSYFSPYTYKVFANVDKKHNWTALVDNTYPLLKEMSKDKLDADKSSGLPPDWVTIDRTTGAINAPVGSNLTTNFSYDAIRTPWRMALDWEWYRDERAKDVLAGFSHLKSEWTEHGKLVSTYSHNGNHAVEYDSPAIYGATIGYFHVMEPNIASNIYDKKLLVLYDPDEQKYKQQLSYYDENWAWFGLALSLDELPNLTDIKD